MVIWFHLVEHLSLFVLSMPREKRTKKRTSTEGNLVVLSGFCCLAFCSGGGRKKRRLEPASSPEYGSTTLASTPLIDTVDLQEVRCQHYFADAVNSIIPKTFLKTTSFTESAVQI